VRSVKAQSKNSAATRSAPVAGSAQLNSAASPTTAPAAETTPTAETAPVRSLAPKPKQVEETFYITKTGKRYHRGSCRHLRYSAYPITRAEAEAQGYTPCRVCYP
jgi:competence protein ComEC